ncbi:MAG: hypothetical protein HYS24_12295 [Ignavibacteriales bacterium]|nr:hypothetical protein [Ignavibacteriales bacterium]MBK7978415.1 hypothetical protein [Ignavibacteriota bacterium]MBK7981221.1 hypothetical protein [Ignavibacteriota bacterium]
MKSITINGIYSNLGKIKIDSQKSIEWRTISNENPPILPFGSKIELAISYNEKDYLNGNNGIVWATYDLRQAEIIQNTLVAQNINCEMKNENLSEFEMFLIKIINTEDINDAVNFIWKSNTGLRLLPDWSYSFGETNKSFEQWLSGN